MPARRIVGWMIALDSKSAWRAERANRAITGVCGMQWLGWLLDSVSLVLRESDVEESRIALVGASAELFGGKAPGGRLHSTTTTLTAYTEVVAVAMPQNEYIERFTKQYVAPILHLASRTSHRLPQHQSCVAICALRSHLNTKNT